MNQSVVDAHLRGLITRFNHKELDNMPHVSEVSIVSTYQGIIGITIWVHHTLSKMNYIKFCVVMEFIFLVNLSIFHNDAWIVGHPKSY
jgi:hypothetical protein